MKKSNYLILICLLLLSCSNPWKDKKYYVLNCKLDGYVASLQEIELNFITDSHVEAKETFNSCLGVIKSYKTDPPIGDQTKILTYTFDGSGENKVVTIDGIKTSLNFTKNGSKELKSNLDEVFYETSIVEILNTEEAKDRVRKASPMPSLSKIYIDMLKEDKRGKINLKVKEDEEQPEGFECRD